MSNVISLQNLATDKVVFGCFVTIADSDTGDEIRYQLVGPLESDIGEKKISVTSPIGKALIGKVVGDEIRVNAPGGTRSFEVMDIAAKEE